MTADFFDKFSVYLSQFRDNSRKKEFKVFLIALAEWRIAQIVLVMLKEGIADFGPLTPRYLFNYSLDSSAKSKELFKRERYDPYAWEYKYYESYEKLYYMYNQIVSTFSPENRNIFSFHNIPPTSLFEYLYRYLFPDETEYTKKKYAGREISR